MATTTRGWENRRRPPSILLFDDTNTRSPVMNTREMSIEWNMVRINVRRRRQQDETKPLAVVVEFFEAKSETIQHTASRNQIRQNTCQL